MYSKKMKKAARVVAVFLKHASEIDAAAIYKRVMDDPMGKATTILSNAKSVGVKGYPKFITSPLISKIEQNVGEYSKKLNGFDPAKVQDFIKKNPNIFKGVQNFQRNVAPIV